MDDYARRFEAELLALDKDDGDGAIDGPHEVRGGMRDDLLLVAALRRCETLQQAEADAARERVRAQLMSVIASESAIIRASDSTEPAHVVASRRQREKVISWGRIRAVAAVAALLAVSAARGWQVSNAAAAAYPGSPLYAVKRLEERAALSTAWSDERRGQVLTTIADHRLRELSYEAAHHNMPLVHMLASEYSADMRTLINLTARMQRQHEDASVVVADLTRELDAEARVMSSARSSGDSALTQALAAAVQEQQDAISAGNLNVAAPALGAPQSNGHASGAGTPSTTPAGQGAGKSQQQGNGGNGGNSGQGSQGGNTGNGGNSGSGGHDGGGGNTGQGSHDTSGNGPSAGNSGAQSSRTHQTSAATGNPVQGKTGVGKGIASSGLSAGVSGNSAHSHPTKR